MGDHFKTNHPGITRDDCYGPPVDLADITSRIETKMLDKTEKDTVVRPKHCRPLDGPEELMQIKEQCHNYEAEKRPKFEEICKLLPSSRS